MREHEMTYSESARGITITRERAITLVRRHECDVDEMLQALGDRPVYTATEVLNWLGY